ncbi:lysozyme, partial [bacterium]|nr:lysozyme [bacterium]
EGKFTFKGQGTTNPNDGNAVWERRANIFYSNMDDKKKLESALPLKSSFKPDESEIIKKHNTTFSNETLKKARTFIQSAEKFEENAYKDEKGIWTIGYGHTYGVKPGDKITKEQAEKLYAEDFKIHSEPLKYVKVPLNNNEKIALASLIYNIGEPQFKTSTVLKMLNEGNKKGAADAFELFCKETKIKKQNGQIVKTKEYSQGLHNRRLEEKKLFLTPDK